MLGINSSKSSKSKGLISSPTIISVLIDFLPKYVVNDSEILELLQNERAEYFRRVREFGLNADLQSMNKLREIYKQLEKE